MKINFKIGGVGHFDLFFSETDSLEDMVESFRELIEDTAENEKVTVSLLGQTGAGLSIPIIFENLMSVIAKEENSERSVCFYVKSQEVISFLRKYIPGEVGITANFRIYGKPVKIVQRNITCINADAIVNASNTRLALGGGVSGAIRKAANPSLQQQMFRIAANRKLKSGDVILTGSHGIKGVRYILHAATVDGTEGAVRKAIRNVLAICDGYAEKHIQSVAFPALGTGTGGLDLEKCANIFLNELNEYFRKNRESVLGEIFLVLFTQTDYDIFKKIFLKSFRGPGLFILNFGL